MASKKWWKCSECRKEISRLGMSLFDALKNEADRKYRECSDCGSKMDLMLQVPFALGVDAGNLRVVGAFYPECVEEWKSGKGALVKYYPFLVVIERARIKPRRNEPGVWLPYWHTVAEKSGLKKKYGQYAPYMDMDLFDSLMEQARLSRLVK